MNIVPVMEATDAGTEAFRAFITETHLVDDPKDRFERARAMLADPLLFRVVPGAGSIDLDARFDTAYDFVRHVAPAIDPLGQAGIRNKGINIFLYLAYVDQVVKAKSRVADSYFLDERTKGGTSSLRNYRNSIYVHLSVYALHRDSELICRTLLGSAPGELNNACERVAQSSSIISSKGALELVILMFFDLEKGGNRRTPKTPKGSRVRNKNANNALKELSAIVFTQCARNYDIGRMSARQMFDLVPPTRGLAPWKKLAEPLFREDRP